MHTEVACSSPGLGACSCTLPAVPLCYQPLKANKPLLFPPDCLSQGEAHADPDSVAVQVQGELANHNQPSTCLCSRGRFLFSLTFLLPQAACFAFFWLCPSCQPQLLKIRKKCHRPKSHLISPTVLKSFVCVAGEGTGCEHIHMGGHGAPGECLRPAYLPVVPGGRAAEVGGDAWPHTPFSLRGCSGTFTGQGLFSLLTLPPFTEPQTFQAGLWHRNVLTEHKHQATRSRKSNTAR